MLQRSRESLGRLYHSQKRYAEAESVFQEQLQHWRNASAEHPSIDDTLFNLACVAALQRKSDEAIGYLREAVDRGFADREALSDPDLASLASHPGFQSLVERMIAKAE